MLQGEQRQIVDHLGQLRKQEVEAITNLKELVGVMQRACPGERDSPGTAILTKIKSRRISL